MDEIRFTPEQRLFIQKQRRRQYRLFLLHGYPLPIFTNTAAPKNKYGFAEFIRNMDEKNPDSMTHAKILRMMPKTGQRLIDEALEARLVHYRDLTGKAGFTRIFHDGSYRACDRCRGRHNPEWLRRRRGGSSI